MHGIDYLLTWNYRHIDNAETKPLIRNICAAQNAEGLTIPEIAKVLGVHRTIVYRIIETLEAHSMVRMEDGKIRLGAGLKYVQFT